MDEKVEYVQSLWDRIAMNEEQVAVPDWHKELIRERLAELKAVPGGSEEWKDVRTRLARQLGEKSTDR